MPAEMWGLAPLWPLMYSASTVDIFLGNLNKMEGNLENPVSANVEEQADNQVSELQRAAVELIIALNAALVNIRMYPSSSDMISTSVEMSFDRLQRVLKVAPKLTLGEANNQLLINGEQLGLRDQSRPPIVSFLTSLRRRDIFSIIISSGMTTEEFTKFLQVLAMAPDEIRQAGGFSDELERVRCEHVLVNERRFVAIGKNEELSIGLGDGGGGEGRGEDTDADLLRSKDEEIARLKEIVKDEKFIAVILGREETEGHEDMVRDILSNPPRLGILLRKAIRELEAEEEQLEEPCLDAVMNSLERVASLVGTVEEQELRDMDREETGKAISMIEPSNLKEYLLMDLPTPVKEMDLRKTILEKMKETRAMELLENVIREHDGLKRQRENGLTPEQEERYGGLSGLIDEIYHAAVGKPWESAVSDRIFQADMWKKIVEGGRGGGGGTGANTLVYQVSNLLVNEGLGLDVDELARNTTIDENVPRLIQKLYRTNRDSVAEKLIHSMLDNLNDMSPEIRLKTAEILENIDMGLEMPKRGRGVGIAYELKSALLERLEKERELTEIYGSIADCLTNLGKNFILNKDYAAATEIINEFWQHYNSPDNRKPEQQALAMEAISEMGDPGVIENLTEVLRTGDVNSIADVANILIKFDDKSVQPLIQVLKDSDDLMIKKVTFDALETIGKDAIKDLINDLEDHNPWHMYRNIVSILAEIGNRSTLQSLSRFLGHRNEEVRRETVKTIGRIKTPETVALLVEALKDRDEVVQRESCVALGLIGDVSTVPVLLDVIKKGSPFHYRRQRPMSVKIAAVWALGRIGDFSAVPEIGRLLKRRLFAVKTTKQIEALQAEAVKALSSIGSPEAMTVLRQSADNGKGPAREAAARELAAYAVRNRAA